MKELDWANLPFGYMKTDYNVRIYYRDGKWGETEVCSEGNHSHAHGSYLPALRARGFRGVESFPGQGRENPCVPPEENAARLQSTCRGILMPELPTERFLEAVRKVVKLNERFIRPTRAVHRFTSGLCW